MNSWLPIRVLNRRQPLTACVNAAEPLRLSFSCANCLCASTQAVRCGVPGSPRSSLLIPYCSRCYTSLEAGKTRVTFAVCASLLCGVAALLVVPMSAWDISAWGYAVVTCLASVVPLLIGFWFRAPPEEGQTSADVAVWSKERAIIGTNAEWITRLAQDNHGQIVTGRGHTRLWTWPAWSCTVLFPALAGGIYSLFYPTVVVLNLSAGEFDLWIDGRRKATVGVSSLESADAAKRLTVPAGRHRFEARLIEDDAVLQSADVNIEAFGLYLFAPGAKGHCFWTESASYGKAHSESIKRPLGGRDGFIVLPPHIDTWFSPNPPVNNDTYSSGGDMVALRHDRCSN